MRKIEEVAKAIYEKRNGPNCTSWGLRPKSHKAPYLDDARAAIEAMREPTEGMKRTVAVNWGSRTWREYGEVIDAALSE